MPIDTATLLLLGVIAVGSLVQAVCLIGLGREVVRTASRLTDLGERVIRGVRPTLEELARASRHIAASSAVLERESRRVDALIEDAVARVQRAEEALYEGFVPSASRVASVLAAARLVRSGYRLYRWFRP